MAREGPTIPGRVATLATCSQALVLLDLGDHLPGGKTSPRVRILPFLRHLPAILVNLPQLSAIGSLVRRGGPVSGGSPVLHSQPPLKGPEGGSLTPTPQFTPPQGIGGGGVRVRAAALSLSATTHCHKSNITVACQPLFLGRDFQVVVGGGLHRGFPGGARDRRLRPRRWPQGADRSRR